MEKYILYARKSTDTEDKQVLSIEAQLCELRKYAKDAGLTVVDELIEKRTAKMPGRPIFNELLTRISAGEANGILAWHPDRLARNSIDGGQIVYLLDQTILNFLKFPMFQFENTSQGKFMLSIMFGQSKYYVDNLSENSKRGLRAKVRSGICPGLAPVGYLNDVRSKTIVVDKRYAPLVKQAFELYSDGDGRRYNTAPVHAPGETINGKTGGKWRDMLPPAGRHWRTNPDELDKLDAQDLIEWSKNGVPRIKKYADEHKGKKIQDIWNYIDPAYPLYPTEKNLDMLEMIIRQSSNENSFVLDCFAGSGSTLLAAQNMGRKWIGIDQSDFSADVIRKRFDNINYNLIES